MSLDPIAAEEAQISPEDLNEEDKVMLIFSYLWVLALVPSWRRAANTCAGTPSRG